MEKYYIVIAGIIAVLAVCYILYTKKKEVREFLNAESTIQFIKKLIIQAEKEIVGTKKGQERLKLVISRIYCIVPAQIKIFITEEALVDIVNALFKEIAVKMEDGTTKAVS